MLTDISPQMYEDIKKDPDLWNLFTKKEEYDPINVDKYGRFTYKFSSHKNVLIPNVSEYLIRHRFHIEYKDGKKFAIFLSHDIDDINISGRQLVRSLVPFPLHRDMFGFKKFISAYLRKRKPYVNFREIIQLEKKYDARSSFYFLTTEKDIFGDKYRIEDLQEEILYILDMECEVGLHTSYYAFDNLDMIKTEKKKLEEISGKKIVGVRNHLLRFKIPLSWELLAKAGFRYDTSLGYHDIVGFRNGTCHPFQPFNLITNKHIDIIEIPLCVIDIALFSYMKKSAAESWNYIKKIIDTVEMFGGVLTILWHNWTFSFPVSYSGLFGKEWTKLYEKILEYGFKKNAWLTNGKNISDHFDKLI